jgi:hypothetical protein
MDAFTRAQPMLMLTVTVGTLVLEKWGTYATHPLLGFSFHTKGRWMN